MNSLPLLSICALCKLCLLLGDFQNNEVLRDDHLLEGLNRLLENFAPVWLFLIFDLVHQSAHIKRHRIV